MVRTNQQRRGRRPHRTSAGEWAPWRVEALVYEGARAAAAGSAERVEGACHGLDECVDVLGWQKVTGTAGTMVSSILASVWEGGWAPVEVVHQVRRQRRPSHGDLVTTALTVPETWELAAGAAMPEVWSGQLASLGVGGGDQGSGAWLLHWLSEHAPILGEVWPVVLETLGVLTSLPAIEPLLPRPSEWARLQWLGSSRPVDDTALTRIRALLAKAESTTFAAESEALSAKAQELMARHAIDGALARAEGSDREPPAARRILLEDPYAAAKSRLLAVVAAANEVRCVWYPHLGMMAVVGYPSDLDAVEMLFTSLLVQATRAMLAQGSVNDRYGRSRTRSFRQSFLLAFAIRIGERLSHAALIARHRAEQDLGGSVLPVLAGRQRQVDDALRQQFPNLGSASGPAATNEAGWRAGRIAAEHAHLGADHPLLRSASAGA
jgi:hypothetical protein